MKNFNIKLCRHRLLNFTKYNGCSTRMLDLPANRHLVQGDVMQQKLEKLQAGVEDIKQSLAALHKRQHTDTTKIMTVLNNMSKEFQPAITSVQNLEERCENVEDNDIRAKYILPVNDLSTLKDMNKELSNDTFFSVMVKHFCRFVGTDGQGRGEVLGKRMAEQIMTRELMTKMSWTGVSRTVGCEKKFAFQTLENLVKLFFTVLIKADSRWSSEKNEKLFSGALLKHAKKRALAEKEKLEIKNSRRQKSLPLERANNPYSTSDESVAQYPTLADMIKIEISSPEFSGETGQDSNDYCGDLN